MSKTVFTHAVYDTLLAAYREHPGNYTRAGIAANVDARTAKKAWETGWRQYPWARPIREVLREEATEAKRRRTEQRLAEQARKQAEEEQQLEESAKSSAIEQSLVNATRNNAIGLAQVVGRLVRASLPIAQDLETQLMSDYKTGKISPLQAIKAVRELAQISRYSGDASRLAIELHRIHQDKPIHVIGIEHMDPEQAAAELEALERTLRRAAAAGIMEEALAEAGAEEKRRVRTTH